MTPFVVNQQQSTNNDEVVMGTHGMDFSKLQGAGVPVFNTAPTNDNDSSKSTQKRKRKSSASSSTGDIITDTFDNTSSRQLNMLESNEPYDQKYNETNNMLRSTVAQIDTCLAEVHDDIEAIRSSKTMRSKYTYLSNLQGAMGTLIGNKIAAARELNSTISKCNDLELRRYKEARSAAMAEEMDDTRRIQEMYQAFVSTPVGGRFTQPLGPSTAEMSIAGNGGIITSALGDDNLSRQYSDYVNNLTPAEHIK